MGGACSTYGVEELNRVLVRKPELKRPHGRTKHRGYHNINVDVKEFARENVVGYCGLGAFVSTVMKLGVP
jgi:hypothetical protein